MIFLPQPIFWYGPNEAAAGSHMQMLRVCMVLSEGLRQEQLDFE